MSEKERARFEAWARPDSVQARRHPETGEYIEPGMSAAWSAWKAAVAVERRACAIIARNGCLVPPDGGSPTDDEISLCNHIEAMILEGSDWMPLPPPPVTDAG